MYLAHYDETGNILGFYVLGVHNEIPRPTIQITADQHKNYFVHGQCYKVINGIWTYVPPSIPTFEEIKVQQLNALDTEYEPRFKELQLAWAAANLDRDTVLAALLQTDYQTLKAEYAARREAVENGK